MQLRKKLRVLAITVGAVAALMAIAASPAMAELVGTKFSASTATVSGTNLTVKKNGGEAKTCELKALTGKTHEGGLEVYSQFWPTFQTILECTGGTKLWISLMATGRYDTVTGAYSLKLNYPGTGGGYVSPYGGMYRIGYPFKEIFAGWTNGSESTPSTINFNETYLGKQEPGLTEDITLSGSLTATTSTGGLLTLSH